MMTPKRILVPLDCSPLSETKLPVVEEYGLALGAEVILLHVLPTGRLTDRHLPRPFEQGTIDAGVVSQEEARAHTFLDASVTRLHAAGVVAQPFVQYGPIAETILEIAREREIALIILGSDVRRGLSRLLLGSVAATVVRDAPCPILLVRPDEAVSSATPEVRSFADDAARAGLLTPRVLGTRTVDLARIVGSVGRANEMGANFRPLKRRRQEEDRYERILALASGGTRPLPPVDLYKLGYGYYAVDGHRRVAAMKELGYDEITANVTEYLPATDTDAQQLFTARLSFERATGLTTVGAARPASYPRLAELIEEFRVLRDLGDRREAAERWRVVIYGDLMRRIRALRINRHFPGERSADIVVRVADYRRDESARQGRELGWEEAAQGFAETLPG